jgi:Bacterial surface proteins containing Ig-like domains
MMRRILMAMLLCVALSSAALAADKAIIKSQIAPLLSEPGGANAERVDEVLFGMVVEVLNQTNASYPFVRTAYGLEAYANQGDLYMNDVDAVAWEGDVNSRVAFPQADIHGNNGSGGNPSHGSNGRMLGWLPKGALIYITSSTQTSSYYPISMPSWVTFIDGPEESPGPGTYSGRFIRGTLGANKPAAYVARFTPSRSLETSGLAEATVRGNLVADALSYCDYRDTMRAIADADLKMLGTMAAPWRKGGKTHQGMDASGLVSMVYLLNDLPASRDATPDFVGTLRPIDAGKQQKGDVLCWGTDGRGVYIDNGQFVFASYEDQVVRIGTLGTGVNDDVNPSDITAWGSVFATPVDGMTVSSQTASLQVGQSRTLSATVSPSGASFTAITWTSSNPAVATVDPVTGVVTAVAAGSTVITAETTDGGFTDSCTFTVTTYTGGGGDDGAGGTTSVPATGVTLNHATLALGVGETAQLAAAVLPTNASNKAVTWTSSAAGVATVDDNGKVTAVGPGSCTISVVTKDGSKTAVCTVTVSGSNVVVPPASVEVDLSGLGLENGILKLSPGEDVDLSVSGTPQGMTFTAIGLPEGLMLTANGRLHGKVPAIGIYTVTLTGTAPNGTTKTETFTIEVKEDEVVVTSDGGSSGCGVGAGVFALILLPVVGIAAKRRR